MVNNRKPTGADLIKLPWENQKICFIQPYFSIFFHFFCILLEVPQIIFKEFGSRVFIFRANPISLFKLSDFFLPKISFIHFLLSIFGLILLFVFAICFKINIFFLIFFIYSI